MNETTFTLDCSAPASAADSARAAEAGHELTQIAIFEETPELAMRILKENNNSLGKTIVVLQERIKRLEQQNVVLNERSSLLEERGKKLAQELDVFRQRRLVYWSDRFRNKFDAWHLMHPAFEEVKDDTMIFQGDLNGFRLLPSLNLVRLSSLRFDLDLSRPGLEAILLAPIIDMPSSEGQLCVRIIDQNQEVLREVSVALHGMKEEQPCEFRFSSLGSLSEKPLSVYIFAQGVDVPIRVFELRKYPLFGFARLQRKLFAGFSFTD